MNSWDYKCEYAVIYDEIADFMLGNGKYYWSGDKKSNVWETFKTTLLKLCKGTPSELEYSVIYFEKHCRNEKVENTHFYFDNDFIDLFIQTASDRCEKDEMILREDYAPIWRMLVVYNN